MNKRISIIFISIQGLVVLTLITLLMLMHFSRQNQFNLIPYDTMWTGIKIITYGFPFIIIGYATVVSLNNKRSENKQD
ncbi:hypothetical protein [Lactobacillus sp. Sy-1]|uniref:hypothetical protein n=1 Tax=Lactobacillus sp. Sy-1 TaxID=2109645 RepID=UPI001C5B9ED5|nr:hypothetical protein [Lactobacillus sp. Sy-1]MBW1606290.1 hypothetical protein [Lactobacillus sp. Sy-1]